MTQYASEVRIHLESTTGPDLQIPVVLKACPDYKSGAYYVGRMLVSGVEFKVKAICVQSTSGGRVWVSWDEKLEKKLERYTVNNLPRPVQIAINRPGEPKLLGDYIVIMHPLSELDD